MKKLTYVMAFFMLANVAFGGGLLTNTNQSAQFIRMLSRNASLEIDAVFYNPAGLVKLEDGWHFSISSQTIFQNKNVESKFPLLNDGIYQGKVTVPVFPAAYAVYKKDKWALSFGFSPNAGGGSAEFERGLPSFEIPYSKIAPGLAELSMLSQVGMNLDLPSGYDADLYFSGSSIFWGIQLGATYKINDIFSVYGGVRYMPAKNAYQGSIKNVELDFNGQKQNAMGWLNNTASEIGDQSTYYSGLAAMASAGATQLSGAAAGLQPIIDGGAGSYTIDQLEMGGMITATQKAVMVGTLSTLGVPEDQIAVMPISTVQGTFSTASTTYQEQAAQANGAAFLLGGIATGLEEGAGDLDDREVDVEQTGAGFTPMFGINISPNEDWNIGVKYEMKTNLKLKNSTKVDDLGMFPDGVEVDSDVPAILGVGVGYRGLDWLEAQLSYTMFFDKDVEWGYNTRDLAIWKDVDPTKIRIREINKNGYEAALGLQFNISENFAFSVGGLYGGNGVADSYQSDFSYSNPYFSGGAGIMWKITDRLILDAGVSSIFYQDVTVTFEDPDLPDYNDIYGKDAISFAIGLSYSIF